MALKTKKEALETNAVVNNFSSKASVLFHHLNKNDDDATFAHTETSPNTPHLYNFYHINTIDLVL